MKQLCLYTIFETDRLRPRCTGIRIGDKVQVYDLYRAGSRKALHLIEEDIRLIRDLIITASNRGVAISISDFKSHLTAFDLPLDLHRYNVYDMHLPDVGPSADLNSDTETLKVILERMHRGRFKEYQKLLANVSVVYQDMQNKGLLDTYMPVYPQWSLKSFTGRAKSTGFSIHGFTEQRQILPQGFDDKSVLIHFDWVCADIRVASLLSGDETLMSTFDYSDPYTYIMETINSDSDNHLTRNECKRLLLREINSMDFTGVALSQIFPKLGEWIRRCSKSLIEKGWLESILGRRFRVSNDRTPLAVLNAVMQGSVGHAMHNVLRRVWERMGRKIVTDIHDSLILASSSEPADVRATINTGVEIMLRPFDGLLMSNPVFPVKVSIGKKWRKWKLGMIYRADGVYNVKEQEEESEEEKGEGEEASETSSESEA